MRRMYSEQELTNVIKKVFEEELESGALDELVSDAVDAYLVEHPVDITALEGQDISPKDVSATGDITAKSIIETMTGYSFTPQSISNVTLNPIFASAVKNGNKLTFAYFGEITRTDTASNGQLGYFDIPTSVASKLYPFNLSGVNALSVQKIQAFEYATTSVDINAVFAKHATVDGRIPVLLYNLSNLTANTKYLIRLEVTFLLSDSYIPD